MATLFTVQAEKVVRDDPAQKVVGGDKVEIEAESKAEARLLFLETHPVPSTVEWRFVVVVES